MPIALTIQNARRATNQRSAFLTCFADTPRIGLATTADVDGMQHWFLEPRADETFEVRSMGKVLSVKGDQPILVDDADTRWKFSVISGTLHRISADDKFLTANPESGAVALKPLMTGRQRDWQTWRCLPCCRK